MASADGLNEWPIISAATHGLDRLRRKSTMVQLSRPGLFAGGDPVLSMNDVSNRNLYTTTLESTILEVTESLHLAITEERKTQPCNGAVKRLLEELKSEKCNLKWFEEFALIYEIVALCASLSDLQCYDWNLEPEIFDLSEPLVKAGQQAWETEGMRWNFRPILKHMKSETIIGGQPETFVLLCNGSSHGGKCYEGRSGYRGILFARCHVLLQECHDVAMHVSLGETLIGRFPVELVDIIVGFAIEGRTLVADPGSSTALSVSAITDMEGHYEQQFLTCLSALLSALRRPLREAICQSASEDLCVHGMLEAIEQRR